jgi:hypothetical protein
MDGAFEAIECHRATALGDAERFVIVITADITFRHGMLLSKHGFNGRQWIGFQYRNDGIDRGGTAVRYWQQALACRFMQIELRRGHPVQRGRRLIA